mmetsp:Transcript_17821/g.30116  ORF Transcript_17821/g.30116 Transcript_17821/m.30116 type:complete len:83 (+) Transcript_17821:275-523(+)
MRSVGQQTTSLRITTCLGDLCEPNGGIDGKCLVGESLDGDAFAGWEEEAPEIFDSHLLLLLLGRLFKRQRLNEVFFNELQRA